MIDLNQQTAALLNQFCMDLPCCGDCPYFDKSAEFPHCIYGQKPSNICPGASLRNINPQKKE